MPPEGERTIGAYSVCPVGVGIGGSGPPLPNFTTREPVLYRRPAAVDLVDGVGELVGALHVEEIFRPLGATSVIRPSYRLRVHRTFIGQLVDDHFDELDPHRCGAGSATASEKASRTAWLSSLTNERMTVPRPLLAVAAFLI